MPYVRRKRTLRRKKPTKSIKSFATRVKQVVQKSALPQTVEFAVVNTVSTAGLFIDLTNIAEGAGAGQRLGDKILITKIEMRGLWYDADDEYNYCRAFVTNYTEGSAGVPVMADFFTPTYTRSLPWQHEVTAQFNGNAKWAHILKRGKVHRLCQSTVDYTSIASAADTSAPRSSPEMLTWSSSKGIMVKYDSANSPIKNRPYLMLVSDSFAALHPNIDGSVRVTYRVLS